MDRLFKKSLQEKELQFLGKAYCPRCRKYFKEVDFSMEVCPYCGTPLLKQKDNE